MAPAAQGIMQSEIWRNLPADVLERILARLPTEVFLGLRCVCKRWNHLLSSPGFVSQCRNAASSSPSPSASGMRRWLVMVKRQEEMLMRAYDSDTHKWHTICLNFVPHACAEVVAAAGGLLCLRTPTVLVVCNPVTRNWKELPLPPTERNLCAVAITASEADAGYTVVAAAGARVGLYDSRRGSWRYAGGTPPLRPKLRYEATFCEGRIYFSTSEPLQAPTAAYYDVARDEWARVAAPWPSGLTCARLAACGPELYLVGGVGANGISTAIWVWRLAEQGRRWEGVQQMPHMMCKKFLALCYHNYEHICVVAHEDVVCLSCFTWPEALVLKLSRRTWHWWPRCPAIADKASCGFKWFSLVPTLYQLP